MNGKEQLRGIMKTDFSMIEQDIDSCINQLSMILNISKIVNIKVDDCIEHRLTVLTSDGMTGNIRFKDKDLELTIH